MVDKINNENVKKRDLELILEVNKKAIEIQSEVVEQNEEIIDSLSEIKKTQADHDEKIDKLVKQAEETNKDLFRIQVLFVTGLLSLAIQIIQIFIKK
jgi:hypothetical protein